MKNDKAVYLLVKEIRDEANSFVNYVDAFNQCAMTDRAVETIIESAKKLAKAYGENFQDNHKEKYCHINDCWRALDEAATVDQVEDLFECFPHWSGEWSWFIQDYRFYVRNEYFDKDADCYEEDTRELDGILDLEDYYDEEEEE